MNTHLTEVSSLVEAEGKQKGSKDSKASLLLPLKKSASHRFRFHITDRYCHFSGITVTLSLKMLIPCRTEQDGLRSNIL